ncbi:SRPBCC family protein [Nocardia thailandica]
MELTVTREIAAPVARVWSVITDLDAAAATLSGVIAVERIAGDGYEVGTAWRETRVVFGRQTTEEMVVAEVEAPRRTVVRSEARGARYATEFLLTEAGPERSRLTVTFSGEQTRGLVARVLEFVLGPMGRAVSRRMLAQDLADVAAAAEHPARHD